MVQRLITTSIIRVINKTLEIVAQEIDIRFSDRSPHQLFSFSPSSHHASIKMSGSNLATPHSVGNFCAYDNYPIFLYRFECRYVVASFFPFCVVLEQLAWHSKRLQRSADLFSLFGCKDEQNVAASIETTSRKQINGVDEIV